MHLKLLLPSLHDGLKAIEAHKIGLVLVLASFEDLSLFENGLLTFLTFIQAVGQLPLQLVLASVEKAFLFGQEFPIFSQLGLTSVEFGLSLTLVVLFGVKASDLRVKVAFAFLNLPRRLANGFLNPGEAIAAFPVAVVELLAQVGQFPPRRGQFFLLDRQLLDALADLRMLLFDFFTDVAQGLLTF
jgi:hypothetical protein